MGKQVHPTIENYRKVFCNVAHDTPYFANPCNNVKSSPFESLNRAAMIFPDAQPTIYTSGFTIKRH